MSYCCILQAAIYGYLLYKLVWFYISRNDSYWTSRGITTVFFSEVGSLFQVFTNKLLPTDIDSRFYSLHPTEPYVGTLEFGKPALIIRDLDLVKNIFVKDFDHFVDRRTFHIGGDLSDSFIFNMTGSEWKSARSAMTPMFTASKIRQMFPHMDRSSEELKKFVQRQVRSSGSNEFVLRDVFGRYTMDVIIATAFGSEAGCWNPQRPSKFLQMASQIQAVSLMGTVKFLLAAVLPKWAVELTGICVFDAEAMWFFKSVFAKAIKARRSGQKGEFHDFIADFTKTMDSRSRVETVKGSEVLETFETDAEIKGAFLERKAAFTDLEILASSFNFMLAGFDTTENLITCAAYEMALKPGIQDKLREEVESVCGEYSGKVTYEAIGRMQYLDMLVQEVLRLYPPASRTERKVTKPYALPGSDVTLPVGMIVSIPIIGFHKDPEIFPEPDKFDPERFSAQEKLRRHSYAWMPFGHGPRGCIGMRFAMVQAKAAIANLVLNFDMKPCNDTWVPMRLETIPGAVKAKTGLKVSLYCRS